MLPPGNWPSILMLGAAIAAVFQAKPPAPPPIRLTVEAITPSATIDATGDRHLLATADALWISSREAGTLTRVDTKTNKPTHTVVVNGAPCGAMTFAFGSVWVPLCSKGVARVDPKTNTVAGALAIPAPAQTGAVVSGVGSIWTIADANGTITRLDPGANVPVAEIYTAPGAAALAFGADALWIASPTGDSVTRVNPHTNVITQTIKVAGGPASLAVADGALWTMNRGAGTVSRIDVKTNKLVETIAIGIGAGGVILSANGSIWISRSGVPLARIDPRTNRLAQVFTGAAGGAMTFGHGALWLAATPSAVWRLDPKFVEALRPKDPEAR